jgi:hypothetical protein
MENKQDRLRRGRLRQLDLLLDALERLNLMEATTLPDEVRRGLMAVGIQVHGRPDFTALIERVWEIQEQYLNPGGPLDSGFRRQAHG